MRCSHRRSVALATAALSVGALTAAIPARPAEARTQIDRAVAPDGRLEQVVRIDGEVVRVVGAVSGTPTLSSGGGAMGPTDGLWAVSLPTVQNGWYELGLFDERGWVHRSGDYLLRSDDGGITWVPPLGATPYAGATQRLIAAGPDELWLWSADRLFRTDDAAATWQEVALPAPPPMEDRHLFGMIWSGDVEGDRVVITRSVDPLDSTTWCHDREASYLEVLVSLDRGATWTSTIIHRGWSGSFVAEAGEVMAVSVDPWRPNGVGCSVGGSGWMGETIHVSRDDGVTWELARECHALGAGCSSIDGGSAGLFLGDVNGGVHHSVDGAQSFTSVTLPNALPVGDVSSEYDWVMGVVVLEDGFGFAATNGGGTWRTVDGGVSFEPEKSAQELQGVAIGSLGVADRNHALAGGPNAVSRRLDIDS